VMEIQIPNLVLKTLMDFPVLEGLSPVFPPWEKRMISLLKRKGLLDQALGRVLPPVYPQGQLELDLYEMDMRKAGELIKDKMDDMSKERWVDEEDPRIIWSQLKETYRPMGRKGYAMAMRALIGERLEVGGDVLEWGARLHSIKADLEALGKDLPSTPDEVVAAICIHAVPLDKVALVEGMEILAETKGVDWSLDWVLNKFAESQRSSDMINGVTPAERIQAFHKTKEFRNVAPGATTPGARKEVIPCEWQDIRLCQVLFL